MEETKKEEIKLTKNEQNIMNDYFKNPEFNKHFDNIWSPFKKKNKSMSKKETAKYFFIFGIESFKKAQEEEMKKQEKEKDAKTKN